MINSRAVLVAGMVGTVLQVAMVVAGHTNPSVAAMFAIGGMAISLIAGVIYAYLANGDRSIGGLMSGGAIAGGVCGFIGILVSHLMGDVPPSLLALGTLSSVVTGAIGGAIGKAFGRTVAAS